MSATTAPTQSYLEQSAQYKANFNSVLKTMSEVEGTYRPIKESVYKVLHSRNSVSQEERDHFNNWQVMLYFFVFNISK